MNTLLDNRKLEGERGGVEELEGMIKIHCMKTIFIIKKNKWIKLK